MALISNTTWLLWSTPSWYTGQQPPLWTFRKGGLLQSHYNTRPLETQMAANTVLPHRRWFWHWICGHRALQPSPLSPAKVPPSPNQYGRQQDCGLECPIGFSKQPSTHWHEILCQKPTSQPKLAYAQEASTIAIHRNTNCIWPENPVYTRLTQIGFPIARTHQASSKNYWVPTALCTNCQ